MGFKSWKLEFDDEVRKNERAIKYIEEINIENKNLVETLRTRDQTIRTQEYEIMELKKKLEIIPYLEGVIKTQAIKVGELTADNHHHLGENQKMHSHL